MADKKVVFVAFAIEDEAQRNLLKGQSLNTKTPFEYIDMSVKDAYDTEWKARVQDSPRQLLMTLLPTSWRACPRETCDSWH